MIKRINDWLAFHRWKSNYKFIYKMGLRVAAGNAKKRKILRELAEPDKQTPKYIPCQQINNKQNLP